MPADQTNQATARGGSHREVVLLSWPAVINMLSITLMGVADTYFVGKLGTDPQGAVGFCTTLFWAVVALSAGTLEIVQTFVAQHQGGGRADRAAFSASAGYHLAWLFALLALPLAFAGPSFFALWGTSEELIPHATEYFSVRMLGVVFFLVSRVGDGYYRGLGDTLTPMIVTILANVANVVLTPLMIFGLPSLSIPALGVGGAAWATVIATVLHCIVYQALLNRRASRHQDVPRWSDWDPSEMKALLKLGLPSGMHWLLDISAWTLFSMAVARLSPEQVAANTVGITIIRTSFMPAHGIGSAAQTLVGQYLGARDLSSAVRSGWSSVRVTCLYMFFMGILFLVYRRELVGFFSEDPAVIELGSRLMLWGALFQLGDGIQMVTAGALRGAGDTRFVMMSSLTGAWFVFVPFSFILLSFHPSAESGWIAINAWVVTLAIMQMWRFKGRAWRRTLLE